jgi:hypothetical protein
MAPIAKPVSTLDTVTRRAAEREQFVSQLIESLQLRAREVEERVASVEDALRLRGIRLK